MALHNDRKSAPFNIDSMEALVSHPSWHAVLFDATRMWRATLRGWDQAQTGLRRNDRSVPHFSHTTPIHTPVT